MTEDLTAAAARVLAACQAKGIKLATAESCTGGLVAAALTAIAGSSTVLERGFVTYSNEAKAEMLGVPMVLIQTHGAVSEAVARAMAEGALTHSHAQRSIAITGIAGPGGGSADKPVGLVHFAAASVGGMTIARHEIFSGDRDAVRHQAALTALKMVGQL
ncbi:MAG: CinA family protein [Rhodospirillaceae bacterium]|nr:CinA family protein [Rhodospirillales bacterium]